MSHEQTNTEQSESVLAEECPQCGAQPNEPCRNVRTIDGSQHNGIHPERYTVANLARSRRS